MTEEKTTFTWESFSEGCDDFRAKLRESVRGANISIKDKKICQQCGSEIKIINYGMGYEYDTLKCDRCGYVVYSSKSTWVDIDGTEHEVML